MMTPENDLTAFEDAKANAIRDAVAQEREACAVLVEKTDVRLDTYALHLQQRIAKAIRARGNS